MEKVKVVKAIPGILNVGDTLVSPVEGADFCLEETKVTKGGSSERFVSLDYVTVSENIPSFFVFDNEVEELDFELDPETLCDKHSWRSSKEVTDRYNFFTKQFESSIPGSEAQVVYKNLMWFIEWLKGNIELI